MLSMRRENRLTMLLQLRLVWHYFWQPVYTVHRPAGRKHNVQPQLLLLLQLLFACSISTWARQPSHKNSAAAVLIQLLWSLWIHDDDDDDDDDDAFCVTNDNYSKVNLPRCLSVIADNVAAYTQLLDISTALQLRCCTAVLATSPRSDRPSWSLQLRHLQAGLSVNFDLSGISLCFTANFLEYAQSVSAVYYSTHISYRSKRAPNKTAF